MTTESTGPLIPYAEARTRLPRRHSQILEAQERDANLTSNQLRLAIVPGSPPEPLIASQTAPSARTTWKSSLCHSSGCSNSARPIAHAFIGLYFRSDSASISLTIGDELSRDAPNHSFFYERLCSASDLQFITNCSVGPCVADRRYPRARLTPRQRPRAGTKAGDRTTMPLRLIPESRGGLPGTRS